MKLSDYTISTIVKFFADSHIPEDQLQLAPYLSGSKLVELFNKAGLRDIYANSLPDGLSRSAYTIDRLRKLSGTPQLVLLIQSLFDSRHFALDHNRDIDKAAVEFNKLILPDGYRIEKVNEFYKVIGADPPEKIEVEIHFEDIENQILEQISNARFIIWVAVAWFTNKRLGKALQEKIREGVNVRLVVLEDNINREYGFNYEKLCETKRLPPEGPYKNIMHHKFCVIDLKTVIHGSYNWTTKANWNKEDISIDSSKELAEQYAEKFIKLING
ncbi:phospholipase D-like domain-containing protein [Dysgonomonas capnocytophagoides]|uniref:phospholipase D-like domain-containing protein n=1 Tax=Dysgonomonas capnocytophagoides TaxID=45254 RepID=UPI002923F68F|nr:phospholipase D-like domain-containing protein [Dysgonomonas capnocytophagoides]